MSDCLKVTDKDKEPLCEVDVWPTDGSDRPTQLHAVAATVARRTSQQWTPPSREELAVQR